MLLIIVFVHVVFLQFVYNFNVLDFCRLYSDVHSPTITRLVIGTSRTVGSAKKFVRIISGFGGGEHEDTSQGLCFKNMSKIEICFFTARILQNQRMLCCGECFHD